MGGSPDDAERVLVPMEGSERAERAFEHALDHSEGVLVMLTVIDPFDTDPTSTGYHSPTGVPGMPGYTEEWYAGARNDAEELHDSARERAGDRPVESAVVFGKPTRCIVEFADEHGIDHIVIGNHARNGRFRGLLGNTATSVVRHSRVPVTVVR